MQQKIKQPEDLRVWFNKTNAGTGNAIGQAASAGLAYVEVPTTDIASDWRLIYEWCAENGAQNKDFFLYWFGAKLHGFFKDPKFALMFKLKWG